jgi:hypothetical protein
MSGLLSRSHMNAGQDGFPRHEFQTLLRPLTDVGVQYEVHLRAGDANHQRVQRVMLIAFRSEPIRELEELFLVDHAQHCRRRPLHDLIFEGDER